MKPQIPVICAQKHELERLYREAGFNEVPDTENHIIRGTKIVLVEKMPIKSICLEVSVTKSEPGIDVSTKSIGVEP